jgi:hypothetical protein
VPIKISLGAKFGIGAIGLPVLVQCIPMFLLIILEMTDLISFKL